MKRIAICGLHTECSTYNPLLQQQSDFTRTEGRDLLAMVPVDFGAAGIEAVPLFHDRSVPGGPVAPEVFKGQCAALIDGLRGALPLDGVLLLMHGAMAVPGVADPEGAFMESVRDVVGQEAIIAVSYDLHGQVTQRIVENIDAFAAYRTAPHIDVAETHARAARLLIDALSGGPRPLVVHEPVPILVSGEMSSTRVAPCDALYSQLPDYDRESGVLDSNMMIGYVWADTPRATAAAVVTCTDRAVGEAVAHRIADAYWSARHSLTFDMMTLPLDQALAQVDGPTTLADSGDNPTAGGVGDRADVLATVMAEFPHPTIFAGIADPTAFAAIARGTDAVDVGGSLGGGGPSVRIEIDGARVIGDCAVVRTGHLTIVVTEKRRPFHMMSDFAELGLDLADHALLVVKSGYLSPDIAALPRKQIMLLTEGAVSQDLARLQNDHRPRPTFPFQRDA